MWHWCTDSKVCGCFFEAPSTTCSVEPAVALVRRWGGYGRSIIMNYPYFMKNTSYVCLNNLCWMSYYTPRVNFQESFYVVDIKLRPPKQIWKGHKALPESLLHPGCELLMIGFLPKEGGRNAEGFIRKPHSIQRIVWPSVMFSKTSQYKTMAVDNHRQ